MSKKLFLYAGQGSQYFHMGEYFYQNNRTYREWMDFFEKIYYKKTGNSILNYIYSEDKGIGVPMDNIEYTGAAIFMTEIALTQMLIEDGIAPDAVSGISMGEFSASAVAGILNMQDALENIIDISFLVKKRCPIGKMIAVLDSSNLYYESQWMNQYSTIAAENYDTHFIISGSLKNMENIQKRLSDMNINYVVLPVRYGFHSNEIDEIRDLVIQQNSKLLLKNSICEYISGLYGKRITDFNGMYYWKAIRERMRFREVIQQMEEDVIYIDMSPDGSLSNIKNYITGNKGNTYSVLSMFRKDDKLLLDLKNEINMK